MKRQNLIPYSLYLTVWGWCMTRLRSEKRATSNWALLSTSSMSYAPRRNVSVWFNATWHCVRLTCGPKVLVWDSIDMSLAGIIRTWWEHDKVTQPLKAFRGVRCLFISFARFVLTSLLPRPCAHLSYKSLVWSTQRRIVQT